MNEIDVRELSKDEKLKLLREVLEKYHRGYLCWKIATMAINCGYATTEQHWKTSGSYLAQKLIPEILQFKPAGVNSDGEWFEFPKCKEDPDLIRKGVLKDLIELIIKS